MQGFIMYKGHCGISRQVRVMYITISFSNFWDTLYIHLQILIWLYHHSLLHLWLLLQREGEREREREERERRERKRGERDRREREEKKTEEREREKEREERERESCTAAVGTRHCISSRGQTFLKMTGLCKFICFLACVSILLKHLA
jgi:hypothetical protein